MSQQNPSRHLNASEVILANAIDFLNGGLSLLFRQSVTSREAKLSIVSIQTAIELLAKYRLVKDGGLATIVRGELPHGSLTVAAQTGKLRTIGYSECVERIRRQDGISETDDSLIRAIQNLRNALVHFSAEIDIDDVRMSIAWLLIRALAMFAAGTDRDLGEMQTHRSFLDPDNFSTLTGFEPYRSESVDAANDALDSDEVFRCWECEADALSVRESGTYFCYCCGLSAVNIVAGYADCGLCGRRKGVCYDALNTTEGHYRGRCLYCRTSVWIWRCHFCGSTRTTMERTQIGACVDCGL